MHPDQSTSDSHRYKAPDSDADQEGGEETVPQTPELSKEAEAETTRKEDEANDDAAS